MGGFFKWVEERINTAAKLMSTDNYRLIFDLSKQLTDSYDCNIYFVYL